MSFKNDLKNAQILIGNVEFGVKSRLTYQQRFDLLKFKTPWPDEKIERVLKEGWGQ